MKTDAKLAAMMASSVRLEKRTGEGIRDCRRTRFTSFCTKAKNVELLLMRQPILLEEIMGLAVRVGAASLFFLVSYHEGQAVRLIWGLRQIPTLNNLKIVMLALRFLAFICMYATPSFHLPEPIWYCYKQSTDMLHHVSPLPSDRQTTSTYARLF